MAHAGWLFRKRTPSELAEKYPGAGWIFWCDLAPFGIWFGLMHKFSQFNTYEDPDAAYIFIGSKCIIETSLPDFDFRDYWDDFPTTLEDV